MISVDLLIKFTDEKLLNRVVFFNVLNNQCQSIQCPQKKKK